MPKAKQNILFISHAASRSGAPILLLEIIRQFKQQSDLPFRILLLSDGELAKEFRELGPTFIWRRRNPANAYILFCLRKTSLVFSNTILNGHIHHKLLFLSCRFITYIHELETVIHTMTNPQSLKVVLDHTHFFLAGSASVKDNLVTNHGVLPERIRVVYSSIPLLVREKKDHLPAIASFRDKFGVPVDAPVIGVAGVNEWRKGFDLFFPLVKVYFNLYPESPVHFAWLGVRDQHYTWFNDLYDYKKSEIGARTHLIAHGSDYPGHMACFDIHLLLSREDPYPLVVLDAAAFGLPTVCFSGAGGTPEFVEEDGGICVPYGDLVQMAAGLHKLVANPALAARMGAKAREKVGQRHDQAKATSEMIGLINEFINPPVSTRRK